MRPPSSRGAIAVSFAIHLRMRFPFFSASPFAFRPVSSCDLRRFQLRPAAAAFPAVPRHRAVLRARRSAAAGAAGLRGLPPLSVRRPHLAWESAAVMSRLTIRTSKGCWLWRHLLVSLFGFPRLAGQVASLRFRDAAGLHRLSCELTRGLGAPVRLPPRELAQLLFSCGISRCPGISWCPSPPAACKRRGGRFGSVPLSAMSASSARRRARAPGSSISMNDWPVVISRCPGISRCPETTFAARGGSPSLMVLTEPSAEDLGTPVLKREGKRTPRSPGPSDRVHARERTQ